MPTFIAASIEQRRLLFRRSVQVEQLLLGFADANAACGHEIDGDGDSGAGDVARCAAAAVCQDAAALSA